MNSCSNALILKYYWLPCKVLEIPHFIGTVVGNERAAPRLLASWKMWRTYGNINAGSSVSGFIYNSKQEFGLIGLGQSVSLVVIFLHPEYHLPTHLSSTPSLLNPLPPCAKPYRSELLFRSHEHNLKQSSYQYYCNMQKTFFQFTSGQGAILLCFWKWES